MDPHSNSVADHLTDEDSEKQEASQTADQVKVLACKPGHLSSMPGDHIKVGEN